MKMTIEIPNDKITIVATAYGIYEADYATPAAALTALKKALIARLKEPVVQINKRTILDSALMDAAYIVPITESVL